MKTEEILEELMQHNNETTALLTMLKRRIEQPYEEEMVVIPRRVLKKIVELLEEQSCKHLSRTVGEDGWYCNDCDYVTNDLEEQPKVDLMSIVPNVGASGKSGTGAESRHANTEEQPRLNRKARYTNPYDPTEGVR